MRPVEIGCLVVTSLLVATFFIAPVTVTATMSEVHADAGPDQTVRRDEIVYFDGSGSWSDPPGPLTYYWFFRDQATGSSPTPTHAFGAEGVYDVGLVVQDGNGIMDLDTVRITVHNDVPGVEIDGADAGPDQAVQEDEDVVFDASNSWPHVPDKTGFLFEWDFGDGSSGSGIIATHPYPRGGQYVVTLRVTDTDGVVDEDTAIVTVSNAPPVADAGSDSVVFEDDLVVFDASGTTDTPTDISEMLYSWDFGDGQKGAGEVASHSYQNSGVYVATLSAMDNDGIADSDTRTITVQNAPPVADGGPDKAASEGEAVFFESFSSDTTSDEPLLYEMWNIGEGKRVTTLVFDDLSFPVQIEVIDDDLSSDFDSVDMNIGNLPPSVGIIGFDGPTAMGWIFDAYAFDPGADDLTFTWDFGDGSPPEVHFYEFPPGVVHSCEVFDSVTHIFPIDPLNPVTWTITLTVEDDDGGSDFDTILFTVYPNPETPPDVDNLAPLAMLLWSGQILNENEEGVFSARADDPFESSFTFTWDFGDGNTGLGDYVIHDYGQQGLYMVTVTATDSFGESTTDSELVGVQNVFPTANAGPDLNGDEDEVLTFDGGQTYDAPDDMPYLQYSWNMGDGSVLSGEVVQHSYQLVGFYQVTLTVVDDNNAMSQDTTYVTVDNVQPSASTAGSETIGMEDETVAFDASQSTDTTSDVPLLTYSWDFGDGGVAVGMTPTHSYTSWGSKNVVLQVTDDDGSFATDIHQVTIGNAAPRTHAGPDLFIYGEIISASFIGRGFDTYSDSPSLTYSWDFGDGGEAEGPIVTHEFDSTGSYIVTLAVSDGEVDTYDDLLVEVVVDRDGDCLNDEYEITLGTDPLNFDSDNDQLVDSFEEDEYLTDPSLYDSDSDGLSDWEELFEGEDGFITDPDDPDTDNDGLGDADEVYGMNFRAEERHRIPDKVGEDVGVVEVYLPDVQFKGPLSQYILSAEAKVGITHPEVAELEIRIDNWHYSKIVLSQGEANGEHLFVSFDLLEEGFSRNDFRTSMTWTLRIEDHVEGNEGYTEYFEIYLQLRTDPTDYDSDDDTLKDGEELTLGLYGWITDPWWYDTDGDDFGGWDSDAHEIVYGTDPTNPDTDGDGVDDKWDVERLDNVGVQVTLTSMSINTSMDSGGNRPVEGQVVLTIQTYDISTTFSSVIVQGTLTDPDIMDTLTLGQVYTADVYDYGPWAQTTLIIEGWEDDGNYEDDKLDVKAGEGDEFTYDYDFIQGIPTQITTGGDDGDKFDASVTFVVQPIALPRVNTILLNSTDVGVHITEGGPLREGGEMRYTGEKEFYLLYIDATSANAPFTEGLNTILVPRTTFLGSKLSESILDDDVPAMFGGMEFFSQDNSLDTTSDNLVSTISGTLSGTDALTLLEDYLLYNKAGEEIAEYHVVTDCLFTLGLPRDIMRTIPLEPIIYETGDEPNPNSEGPPTWWPWWVQLWHTMIQGAITLGQFIYEGLVAFINFIANLVDMIVEWGQAFIDFLTGLIQEAVEIITEVVTSIIDFIKAWIDAALSSIVSGIVAGMDSMKSEWKAMMTRLLRGYEGIDTAVKDAILGVTDVVSSSIRAFLSVLSGPLMDVFSFVLEHLPVLGGMKELLRIIFPYFLAIVESMADLDEESEQMLLEAFLGELDEDLVTKVEDYGIDLSSKESSISSLTEFLLGMNGIAPTQSLLNWDPGLGGGVPDPPNRYGLIIGGESDNAFWNDVERKYDLLTQRGFPEANIKVLFSDKAPGYGGIVDGPATRDDPNIYDIADAMHDIGSSMETTSNNLLYVFVASHGSSSDYFTIDNGDYDYYWGSFAGDLNSEVGFGDDANYETAIFVLTTCFSELGIDDLTEDGGMTDDKRAVVTATNDQETAKVGTPLVEHAFFAHTLMNQLLLDFGSAFYMGAYQMIWIGVIVGSIVGLVVSIVAGWWGPVFFLWTLLTVWSIGGVIAWMGLCWIDTKGGWGLEVEDVTMWDGFAYARGWTEFGVGIGHQSHPKYFNKALLESTILAEV